ncbi:glycosyltransferase family 4 protein [Microbispora corallina]|uniref:Glycoside hydrolase n=1 Tax=Microbispora corallina TaxID=83302 RepID=A0ABQ4G532_9ACTN|nr:glycosyltransferase family 4 protein [Microbispora corallina]GIH42093.1 glycoside hydrolase [Microbispora corallina]
MRVLHIGHRLPPEPGGKERYIERLVHEQLLRGHEVVIAHRHGEAPPGAESLPLARTAVTRALSLKTDEIAFAVECARALHGMRGIDVIHLHGDHREALGLGPAARRLGIALVVHVHGGMNTRHRRIMPWAFRHVAGFIVSGTRPRADLRAAGIPDRLIRSLPAGVDLERLAAIRESNQVERGLIVSVGSLVPVKNHSLTIAAFHEIRATHPHARLVIVGSGPERARLERLAGPDVRFTGQIPPDEVYRLVSRAEVFVHSSQRLPTIAEGIPTAPLEALALGAAVVVSSESSLEPAVTDEAAYRVFRSGSAADLARHLCGVLDDDAVRRRMAEHGVRAASDLDWPLVAGRIEEWYERLTPARTPRRLNRF